MVFKGNTSTTASFTTPITGNSLFFSFNNVSGGDNTINLKINEISVAKAILSDGDTGYSSSVIRIEPNAEVLLEVTGLLDYYMSVE
jgi:hypothetical protein